ncbi:MAG: SMP-30/gluconolactonase/LRE family protein [Ilumatobacteraceae bacterium]
MNTSTDVVAEGFTFTETPRWHAGRQAWYFVDIDEGELWEMKDGVTRRLHSLNGDYLSGAVFDDADGFYLSSRSDRTILHLTNCLDGPGEVTVFSDLTNIISATIRDLTRGPDGDIYVGGSTFDAIASFDDPSIVPTRGPLLRVRPDGTGEIASDITNFPNGIVITPGNDRLLLADSYDECVYAFPIHDDGSLGAGSMWADLPGDVPDGMGLDEEGALWIASAERGRVIRVLEGGTITDSIELEGLVPTACMLGGADGRTLLITVVGSIKRSIVQASRTSRLLAATVDVAGAGLPSVYA